MMLHLWTVQVFETFLTALKIINNQEIKRNIMQLLILYMYITFNLFARLKEKYRLL